MWIVRLVWNRVHGCYCHISRMFKHKIFFEIAQTKEVGVRLRLLFSALACYVQPFESVLEHDKSLFFHAQFNIDIK